MELLGDREIPFIVRSEPFRVITWLARRFLPLIMTITIFSFAGFISGRPPQLKLPFPDWLGITCLAYGCYVAQAPFANKPRRHPLDQWLSIIFGAIFVLVGLGMAVIALSVKLSFPAGILNFESSCGVCDG
jgi:hypothetical protein